MHCILMLRLSSIRRLISSNPMTSNGSLGALVVPAGNVVFYTDFRDPVVGGTYEINGITQPGTARQALLPLDSGGVPHEEAIVSVYDFTDIDISSGVDVFVNGALGLILLSSNGAAIGGTVHLQGQPGANGGQIDVLRHMAGFQQRKAIAARAIFHRCALEQRGE